jgi:hypothetical protein
MSDFLTRLAQLSRGEAAVVSPRLPGRFDPIQEASLPDQTRFEQHSEWGAARDIGRRRLSPDSGEKPYSPGAADGEPFDRQTGDEPDRPNPIVTQKLNSPVVPGKPAMYSPFIPPTLAHTGQTSSSAVNEGGVSLAEPTAKPGKKVVELSATQHDTRSESAPQQNVGPDKTSKPYGPIRVSRVDPAPLVKVPRNQPGRPQPPATEQPAFNTPAAKQKPSVHINIGRIEVRANTAAPGPAPRPAPPKPQSSLQLQDYLNRSRSDGDRS